MIAFLFFISALIFILVICCITEHFLLITRRQNICLKNLPSSFNNLKILQISDIHHRKFGKDQIRIIKRVKKENPDIIVITGDLISRDMRDFTSAGKFCSSLSEISPVLFSMGNHEIDLPEKVKLTFFKTLKNAGVHILLNSEYTLQNQDDVLKFIGVSLDMSAYRDENFCYDDIPLYSLSKLEKNIGVHSECTVLLAHNPLHFETFASWNADLVLSGHVHGGIIRLPFIGGILSPERKLFPAYTRGLYELNSSQLYVSAGLGKFRIFNPPEINVIKLLSPCDLNSSN